MPFAVCRNSLFRKSRPKPNLESTSKYGFSPDLGGKNGGVLSMRMQVILDSPFARPGSAPIGGGKKGEFRDWTKRNVASELVAVAVEVVVKYCCKCIQSRAVAVKSN